MEAINLPPDAKELEQLWLHTQVLIYHNSDPSEDLKNRAPDCFGNRLTKQFIITSASCFMDVKKILRYSETHDAKPNEREEKWIIEDSIKKDIKKDSETPPPMCCSYCGVGVD